MDSDSIERFVLEFLAVKCSFLAGCVLWYVLHSDNLNSILLRLAFSLFHP